MARLTYYEVEELKTLDLIAKRLDEISKEIKKFNKANRQDGENDDREIKEEGGYQE